MFNELPYNRVIWPGRMQKNLISETEIAQWAHTPGGRIQDNFSWR